MIKTKKTKEILKEWRSFEKKNLNESSYTPSSKANSIKRAAADFLRCSEASLSDASHFSGSEEDDFDFMIGQLQSMGEIENAISINDMIFTDDQTCSIDWGSLPLDKNSEMIPFNDPDSEFYSHKAHPDFDLVYYFSHASPRKSWIFAFFPKANAANQQQDMTSKSWHGKLRLGSKGR
jgi:hypothetical protein